MAKQNETGVPVNVPEFIPYPDGVPVRVPDAPAESTDTANTKGQKATTKEK
jgi:hypothetical protein